ncbi:MAG: four helix bundle protein [Chloroflexi bacterium]|nr:four helix bundle protein [Chloroflexota bacterium]
MAKGDDIQDRLIDFAVSIIHLCAELPKTQAGKHIADQLLRSGTSPAPNYAEARSAESPNDFVHKLKITLKELNETSVWLRIIRRSDMLTPGQLDFVTTECEELSKIINASIKTVLAKKPLRPTTR